MGLVSIAIFITTFATLLLELLLTRVFDVIMTSNMSYMVITCAMFSFGLSGIYLAIRPVTDKAKASKLIALFGFLFAVSTLTMRPLINFLPFDFELLFQEPVSQFIYFGLLYFLIILPFIFSGMIIALVFSNYAEKIQSIYFVDLTGAALGCLFVIPFLPAIGPGGILFLICSLGLVISSIFLDFKPLKYGLLLTAIIISILPFLKSPEYYDFRPHQNKRGVLDAWENENIEYTKWDPISKIDVVKQKEDYLYHVAYDGGSQSTNIFQFDGDFRSLRDRAFIDTYRHFWRRGVLASHYLKKDTGHKVLVIGSAGGQETKAALTFGASHVDAVEMVGAVVDLGKNKYSEYNGNLFNHPKVNAVVGEGRSFIRTNDEKYDVIQIFSNHTSSGIAAGSGALSTTYLQTTDAYKEYFTHLKEDGILHINHHSYPRMIATAGVAWKELGKKDFRKHVIVYERQGKQDNLPTMLIKMSPWTLAEKNILDQLLVNTKLAMETNLEVKNVENPFDPEGSYLSDEFYSGEISKELKDLVPYHIRPSTDDRPYFNFLRKVWGELSPDPDKYMSGNMAFYLNSQLKKDGLIPMDVIHLVITAVVAFLFTIVFTVIPLLFSKVGREKWDSKFSVLSYFACLGAGFIILELVLIQICMKLIGYPLYTYSSVIFTLLFAAGLGSYASNKLKLHEGDRWRFIFMAIFIFGGLFIFIHKPVFHLSLQFDTLTRILVSSALIFPLGFFMGMPFPLGILAIKNKAKGAIAWAWGMNSLFTVVGGFASVLVSLYLGFRVTLVLSLFIYLIAFLLYGKFKPKV